MIKEFEKRNAKFVNKIAISGCIAIFIMASIFHFVFDFTGGSNIAAVFFPVNESIFEHLKLILYPTIIFWLISYLLLKGNYRINFSKWLVGMTYSIITAMLFIVACYYVSNYAFNVSSLIIDILSLLVGSFLGQCLGIHVYNKGDDSFLTALICVIIVLIICVFMGYCTLYPPKLPLFMDPSNGLYGI